MKEGGVGKSKYSKYILNYREQGGVKYQIVLEGFRVVEKYTELILRNYQYRSEDCSRNKKPGSWTNFT